jgi:hypothetical protein
MGLETVYSTPPKLTSSEAELMQCEDVKCQREPGRRDERFKSSTRRVQNEVPISRQVLIVVPIVITILQEGRLEMVGKVQIVRKVRPAMSCHVSSALSCCLVVLSSCCSA